MKEMDKIIKSSQHANKLQSLDKEGKKQNRLGKINIIDN
jgi:hypothetical protein